MKSLTDTYTLHNGVGIPCVGYGTWQMPDGPAGVTAVTAAIDAGYRHIDTAQGYFNEESVGKAVRKSAVPREELFITSKLTNTNHGYDATLESFEVSLEKLGTDYMDMFLIHWPAPIGFRDRWRETIPDTWRAFEELYEAKRIRAIGISNFLPHHMDVLLENVKVVPMVNQIRLCPGETQQLVAGYCEPREILLEAYSPLGTGTVFEMPEMRKLAGKYNRSIAQICLRWSLQMGYLPLPKSVTPARMVENAAVFDFELSEEDVRMIASLPDLGQTKDPDSVPF